MQLRSFSYLILDYNCFLKFTLGINYKSYFFKLPEASSLKPDGKLLDNPKSQILIFNSGEISILAEFMSLFNTLAQFLN